MTIQDTIRKIEAIRDRINAERKASDGVFHLDGAVSLDDVIKVLQDDGHDVVAYEIGPVPELGDDGYLVEVHVDDYLLHVGEWSVWHGGKYAGYRHRFFAWTGETETLQKFDSMTIEDRHFWGEGVWRIGIKRTVALVMGQ